MTESKEPQPLPEPPATPSAPPGPSAPEHWLSSAFIGLLACALLLLPYAAAPEEREVTIVSQGSPLPGATLRCGRLSFTSRANGRIAMPRSCSEGSVSHQGHLTYHGLFNRRIELRQARSLRVLVVSGSDPVPAELQFYEGESDTPVATESTDDLGSLEQNALPKVDLEILVSATGFVTTRVRAHLDVHEVTVTLERTRSLQGQVTHGGTPVTEGSVQVGGSGIWPPRSVPIDRFGRFEIELPGGFYEARATSGSLVSRTRSGIRVPFAEGADGSTANSAPVDTTEGNDVPFVHLELAPGVVVTGTVSGPAHPETTRLWLREASFSMLPLEGLPDRHGRFSLGPFPAGDITLTASADQFLPTEVRSSIAAPSATIPILLQRGGSIRGIVVDDSDHPVVGAVVRFATSLTTSAVTSGAPLGGLGLGVTLGPVPPIPIVSSPTDTATAPILHSDATVATDAEGHFLLHGLWPGSGFVIAEARGFAAARSESVETGAEGLTLVLRRGKTLRGRLLDAGGYPMGNATIAFEASDAAAIPLSVATARDGTFVLEGLAGAGRVVATIFRNGSRSPVASRNLTAIPDEEIVLRAADQNGRLALRVVDDRGFGLGQVSIRLRARGVDAWSDHRTESDGTLALYDLADGPYEVQAQGRDGHWSGRLAQGPTEHTLRLAPFGSLQGRLQPAPDRPTTLRLHSAAGDRTVLTGDDGSFVVRDLASGEYDIATNDQHAMPALGQFTVRPGEPTRILLRYRTALLLRGHVRDGIGENVASANIFIDGNEVATSDSNGRFETRMEVGRHRLVVVHSRAGRSIAMNVDGESEEVEVVLPGRAD